MAVSWIQRFFSLRGVTVDPTDLDVDSSGETDEISLTDTAVVAGAYTYPKSIDVDAKGRVTSLVSGSRATPIDASTLLCWKLDEATAPFVNSGNGGSLNMTAVLGTPVAGCAGLITNCVNIPASTACLGTSATSIEPTANAMSAHVWVYPRVYTANALYLIKRHKSATSWSAPYASILIGASSSADGTLQFGSTFDGTNFTSFSTTTANGVIPLNRWSLLSMTYDGITLKGYLSGTLVGSTAVSGSIHFGTHGSYEAGNLGPGTSQGLQPFNGYLEWASIHSAVHSQDDIRARYRRAFNLI